MMGSGWTADEGLLNIPKLQIRLIIVFLTATSTYTTSLSGVWTARGSNPKTMVGSQAVLLL
jgi:hypothetical protein